MGNKPLNVIEFYDVGASNPQDDHHFDHHYHNDHHSLEGPSTPHEGMEFDSEHSARIFYNSYARRIGFSTRVSVYQRSRRDASIICRQIVCSREGFRRKATDHKFKRHRTITRVGCKAQLTVKKLTSAKWAVTKFIKQHNHELVPPDKVHCLRSHRHVSGPARSLIDTLQAAGMGPSGVMSVLIRESGGINNVGFTKVDCQNYMSHTRQRTLGAGAQVVFDYLRQMQADDPAFFFAVQGCHPISITTDQDRIIRAAVLQVFPATRHRFCIWNIFKEAQERLSEVYQSHPSFDMDFQKCINMTDTVDEFESCWESLIQKYDLRDSEWFQSMYDARQQWVPVYLRDTFFGDMSMLQGSDSIHSYFDGYINASTNIQGLIKQYEKAIATHFEKEVKADYDTMNTPPLLKTPSPMEKQAANLYTRKIFMRFQEELVETLAYAATVIDDIGLSITYRVTKFGEEQKTHFVTFYIFEKRASCSCQMFEFSGIICRHILAVFRVTNVLTLLPCYILKRWTRNAKTQVVFYEHDRGLASDCQESLATRCDNLRREVIKYIEEGAESLDTYNVAMDALHEATRKVAAAKKQNVVHAKNALVNGSEQLQPSCLVEDNKIQDLTAELEHASQKCEAYRTKLLAVLKDMEEQKLKISVKFQSVRSNLKY
ncbi:protein FAR1-RELATED SEQUENCE 5-like isoform X4 [Mercurialis annua]|uniref:protein FAR1-RELATED SEQUENCE 5-like isoform X4 n=1 Tax=Mercurialis annua TaxID=3986 RepID=UPI0021606A3A|nr:protein FAR1-RELATED SEQUENCE 5-like isoform X4 [Mercurialis annua]